MDAKTRRSDWSIWVATGLSLIGLYIGGYFFCLTPVPIDWRLESSMAQYSADVRINGILRHLFAPAHRIDRVIRPKMWIPLSWAEKLDSRNERMMEKRK